MPHDDFPNPLFEEYLHQGEPAQAQRAANWRTAIGLQAVDNLQPSEYLHQVAQQNIEQKISLDQSRQLLESYYKAQTGLTPSADDQRQADLASANIAKILSTDTFAFTTAGFIALHRRIFHGVFKHAGELRTYDISKHEWVLDGASVSYLNWEDLRAAIDWEIAQEKAFRYSGLSADDMVKHLATFVSGLWQIHPFGEGNTRTTAVFTIQYLRSMGFNVDNQPFANNSQYFRNALVRANYRNIARGVDYEPQFLVQFFRNLILGEQAPLRSRDLKI